MDEKNIKKFINDGGFEYIIMKRDYKNNLVDLFIQIENEAYRVASYNTKSERLIIPFPKLFIPSATICKEFILMCEKRL